MVVADTAIIVIRSPIALFLQAKKLAIKNQFNNFITLYLIFYTFSPKYNTIYRKVSRETFYVLTDTFEPQQGYFDNFIVVKRFPWSWRV